MADLKLHEELPQQAKGGLPATIHHIIWPHIHAQSHGLDALCHQM